MCSSCSCSCSSVAVVVDVKMIEFQRVSIPICGPDNLTPREFCKRNGVRIVIIVLAIIIAIVVIVLSLRSSLFW